MELNESPLEDSMDELFDSAPCGYITTLANGRIAKVNETFLTWTGYTRDSLLGEKRFKDLLTVPGKIYHDTHVAPLLQIQSYVREIAFDITRPGRSALSVLVNFVQKIRSDGQPSLTRIVVFDATDRRQYEKELLLARRTAEQAAQIERLAREESERANRAKDEFLALVSHELRTPLSAILGWAQILRQRSAANPEIQRGLEVIERNTRLQVRLVDDLLDMSRIVSGKVRLDVQRVDLSNVIEAALETARPAAESRAIRVQTVLDSSVQVSGDPGRLQQVFWNLLSNAVKFTPREGTVNVVMERVNSHIEVSVIDNGQGISPELMPHVFDRFRQSASAATRQTGGLGLGLSIVKNIVEMHGGSVEARSDGEGKGAHLIVKLPVIVIHTGKDEERAHSRSAVATALTEPTTINLTGVKVLLTDDDESAREVMTHLLSSYGAEVEAVSSAADTLLAIQRFRPDVLISDIGMPGEDGYELIRKVRMLGEGGMTPAIALTALSRLEDRTRAMLAGFQSHLSKPVDSRELLATVASLTGRITLR